MRAASSVPVSGAGVSSCDTRRGPRNRIGTTATAGDGRSSRTRSATSTTKLIRDTERREPRNPVFPATAERDAAALRIDGQVRVIAAPVVNVEEVVHLEEQ